MCLYVDSKECAVAEHDITVYKYVSKRIKLLEGEYNGMSINFDSETVSKCVQMQHEFVWTSPYCSIKKEYTPGMTITDERFVRTTDASNIFFGLHTFASELNAKAHAYNFVRIDGWTGVLKCVIPAGTRYWTNASNDEYCSESLQVCELLCQYYESDLKEFIDSKK